MTHLWRAAVLEVTAVGVANLAAKVSSFTVVSMYSGSSCDQGSPSSIFVVNDTSCDASLCSEYENLTEFYSMTECVTNYKAVLRDKFMDGDYLLESSYASSIGCYNWLFLIAYPLDGKCHPSQMNGKYCATTTRNPDDSVTIEYYMDEVCSDWSWSVDITNESIDTHTCVESGEVKTFYNTYELLTVANSAGIGNSGINSTVIGSERVGSEGISIGAIIGIVAGCIVLLLSICGVAIWRCRHKSANKSDIPIELETDHRKLNHHYRHINSIVTEHQLTGGEWSSQNKRGAAKSMSGDLWDDDAIVAARIPRDRVIIETLISRGGYGEVYCGTYNGQLVAIKMLLPERRKKILHVNEFLAEVKMMSTLEHPRIVEFVGVAWDSLANLCVVSEFMAGGDLRAMLSAFESRHHPMGFDYDKIKIAMHVAHALTYLHSMQPMVLHRDLKSRNILLDTELNAKLTDFGVSRERIDSTMTACVGTSLWMAPEVMMGEHYDDKADMFSFGIVLSELDSHALPYASANDPNDSSRRLPHAVIVQQIMLGNLRVQFSSAAPRSIVELGNACVSVNPNLRPTAAEALYQLHQIMRGM